MLEMNLKTQINNLNYIQYMKYKGSENEDRKSNSESERATKEENSINK